MIITEISRTQRTGITEVHYRTCWMGSTKSVTLHFDAEDAPRHADITEAVRHAVGTALTIAGTNQPKPVKKG